MPGMSGLELSRILLQEGDQDRDLHIIFVTGHAGMAEVIEALKLGADDFLTKPLNSEQLLHSVRRSQEAAVLRDKDRELKLCLAFEAKSSAIEAEGLSLELAKRNRELVEKNHELLNVNELKDEFLAMISHEVNTPLNGIIGFAQLLQGSFEGEGDSNNVELTGHIITSANRLHKHVTSVLNIADAQSGRLRIVKQPLIINDLFQGLMSKYAHEAKARGGTIYVEMDDVSLGCSADPEILGVALGCIVENSLKFSNEGVKVKLRAEKTESGVRLLVTDDGLGMDEKAIGSALHPLRQGGGHSARRFEGMGLGLPLARQYLRLHGGEISIESALGQGVRVAIDLPDQQA